MEQFKALIGAELKSKDIKGIRAEIEDLNNISIKLNFDISEVSKQIKVIKDSIRNLSNSKMSLFEKESADMKSIMSNISSVTNGYSLLSDIKRDIDNTRRSRRTAKSLGDTHNVVVLTEALKSLREQYAATMKIMNSGKILPGQFDNIIDNVNKVKNGLDDLYKGVSGKKLGKVVARLNTSGFEKDVAQVYSLLDRYGKDVDGIEFAVDNFKSAHSRLNEALADNNIPEVLASFDDYSNALKKVKNLADIGSTKKKDIDLEGRKKVLDSQLESFLKVNSAAIPRFGARIDELRAKLASCDDVTFHKISSEFKRLKSEVEGAGLLGKNIKGRLKDKLSEFGVYFSAATVFTHAVNGLKEMARNVYSVDTAMTDLYRVTNLSSAAYSNLYDKMVVSAKEYGSALDTIIKSTASWVRLGFDATTANRLSEISVMYQHVTDLDEKTAVENLVSSYKAFQDELLRLNSGDSAKAVEQVADIYDKLGNEFAVTAADVGGGLTRSASALQVAGNSIQQSAAMITGITEVTQDAERAGTALRTLALRLRGTKAEELEALGEDTEGLITITSKLEEEMQAIAGVKLTDVNGQFRSTYEIVSDLSKVWDKLNTNSQAHILETIAGKNRSSDVAALIRNWEQVEKAMTAASNAEGTAAEENYKYMQSLKGRLDSLKASWQALSGNVLDSSLLKGFVSILTSIVDLLDRVSDAIGGIATIGFFSTLPLIFKNIKNIKGVGSSILKFFSQVDSASGETLSGVKRLSKGFKSLFSIVSAHPFAATIIAISTVAALIHVFAESQSEALKKAQEHAEKTKKESEEIRTKSKNIEELIEKYKDLAKSENKDSSVRNNIKDVQEEITKLVGSQADGLDLVNGKLEEQVRKLEKIKSVSARESLEVSASAYHAAKVVTDKNISYSQVGNNDVIFSGNFSDNVLGAIKKSGNSKFLKSNVSGTRGVSIKSNSLVLELDEDLSSLQRTKKKAEELENVIKGIRENYADYHKDESYHKLKQQLDLYKNDIREQEGAAEGLLESAINVAALSDELSKVNVNSAATYEEYRKKLISIVESNNILNESIADGSIDINTISDSVDAFMSTFDQFSLYYDDWVDEFRNKSVNKAESTMSEAEKSMRRFYTLLESTGKGNFNSGLEEFTKKLDALKNASDNLAKGDLDKSKIVSLIQQFPQLINHKDDLANGLKIMMDDLIGSSDKAGTLLGYFNEQITNIGENTDGAKALEALRDEILGIYNDTKSGFNFDIEVEVSNFDKLSGILKESVSGVGLTQKSLDYIKNTYSSIQGYDPERLLEKTENGIHLNAKALREVEAEYQRVKKQAFVDDISRLTDEYNTASKELDKLKFGTKEYTDAIKNIDGIRKQISEISELATQYDGLTSAYNTWMKAQSSGEEGDMYDSIRNGLEGIQKLYKEGLIGTNAFRSYVDLLSSQDLATASADEVVAAYERLNSTISGTTYKATDFLKSGSDGVYNFLNAVNQLNKEWAYINDKGKWVVDFGVGGDKTVADKLGIDVELVQSILKKTIEYGNNVNLDTLFTKLDTLKSEADKANDKLKALGKTKHTFNFNTEGLSQLNSEIEEAKKVLKSFTDKKGKVDIKAEGAEEARDILATLIRQKQSLDESAILKVDTSNAQSDVERVIVALQEFKAKYNELEVKTAIGADTKQVKAELNSALEKLKIENLEVATKLGIDTTSVEGAIKSVDKLTPEILVKAGVDESLIEGFKEAEHTADGEVIWKNNIEAVTKWAEQSHTAKGTIVWENDDSKIKTLSTYKPIPNIFNRTRPLGNAFIKGNVSKRFNGKALGGELGEELVVRDGEYFTIGSNSAEFFDYKKGDIIFDHKQTKEIFATGEIKRNKPRGKAFSNAGGLPAKKSKIIKALSGNDSPKEVKDKISDKFKEWFSSLFDWIEVRLERQADKISNYLDKAKFQSDSGRYNSSAKNYSKAINATTKQISYQSIAYDKYEKQADKVLSKAVSHGIISKDGASDIKNRVREGRLEISQYSDSIQEVVKSYTEWFNKAKESKKAIDELHRNIRGYVNDLRDVRESERKAKTEEIDNYSSISTGGFGFTGIFKNLQSSHTNRQIATKNKAYENNIAGLQNDTVLLGSSGIKSLKSLKPKSKAYSKAVTDAITAIKSKKHVSDKTLRIISSFSASAYNKLYAYNLSVDNLVNVRLERGIDYATASVDIFKNISDENKNSRDSYDSQISMLKQKAENANSFLSANKSLDKTTQQFDSILQSDNSLVKKFAKTFSQKSKSILGYKKFDSKATLGAKSLVDTIKNTVKSKKEIPPSVLSKLAKYYSKGQISGSFYNACIDYNNSLQYKKEAEAQREIDKQMIISEKRSIGKEKLDNVEGHYNNLASENQVEVERLNKNHTLKTTRGLSLTTKDYQSLIQRSETERNIYSEGANALRNTINSNLSKGLWKVTDQAYKDALATLSSYELKIQDTIIAQQEYNNAIAELPYTNIEKALDLLDNIKNLHSSDSNLKNKLGIELSEEDYQRQIRDNFGKISKYQQQKSQAYSDYLRALSNTDGVYGGKKAEEWLSIYHKADIEINNLRSDNEDLKDSMRDDVYWRAFEKAHKEAKHFEEVISKIDSLIDENMILNSDGKFTDFGISHIANIVSKYEAARKEVQNYSNDIENLNKLYAQGFYTQKEYTDKLSELQKGLLDSASSMKSNINDLVNTYKKASQAELDSLFKLIDARNNALSSKKSYYDYDKTIKSKTKDIQELKAQIDALEGINTSEAKANRARLKAQLSESQSELDDTINEHVIKLSQDALTGLKDSLKEAFDDKWENINSNLGEISKLMGIANQLSSSQTHVIGSALNKLLSHYGINSSDTGISKITGFAKGTKRASKNQIAWTNENGREMIIRPSDGAILTPIKKGDIIPNADLSNNLFDWGRINPDTFASGIANIGNIPEGNSPTAVINQNYGSLLNVEGNVDRDMLPDLQTLLKKSYEYNVREMAKDARKIGIKI